MKIALIAGEASGDRLGARLMAALPLRDDISFLGIGGPMMEAQGLSSLFPMQELSLMGFAEILPHIRRLKRRIQEAVEYIEQQQPDVLVTIDSPGFNFRVAKALRARGRVRPRFIHYVAPTVWAYKPKRAKKTAALFDHLLCVLPFEPPYFEKEGLPATFVGHAVVEDAYVQDDAQRFRQEHNLASDTLLLCVMPGSRKSELNKLLPVFCEAVMRFAQKQKQLAMVIPATAYTAELLRQLPQDWPVQPIIVTGEENKRAAMLASDLALAKSGTVTLEAARAGLPMITAYKVSAASAWMLRRMILTPYVGLVNIMLKRELVPEYLQERCTGDALGSALEALWQNETQRHAQQEGYREAIAMLQAPLPGKLPSEVAAGIILSQ